jgi:hypothetical protein
MIVRIAFVVLLIGYVFSDRLSSTWSAVEAEPAAARPSLGSAVSACDIKGNISLNTGERIYHVPGQEHYNKTIITPSKGERWFCSEGTASAAGWRRARR